MKNSNFNTITRKEFLHQLAMGMGAVGAGICFPGILSAQEFVAGKTDNPKEILILGAGLAGLAAAWELEKAGHSITVLEARNRPGGRVSTLREPFADGLYAEEGAAGYSETYTTALRFIEELGLEKIPYPMPEKPVVHHLKNKRFIVTPGEPVDWPYELTAEERNLGPWGIVTKYIIGTLPQEISQSENWDRPELKEMDEQSLADYMRAQGASEGAVDLVRDTQWFGAVPEETSGLSMAFSDFGLFMGGAPFVLAGGNDTLPRAMAERLKDHIQYNAEVTGIRDEGNKINVMIKEQGSTRDFTADHVVCTLPAPVMNKIKIEPSLPQEKSQAMINLPYLNIIRTYLQVEKPFWLQDDISGNAVSDLLPGAVVGHLNRADAESGPALLENMVAGQKATTMAKMSDKKLLEETLEDMKKIHPEVENYFQKGHVKAWSEDPYAMGAVSWPAPGDVSRYLKLLQQPHGKIHFAGEHTSILRSTMEGALRSGIRAATEVHEAD